MPSESSRVLRVLRVLECVVGDEHYCIETTNVDAVMQAAEARMVSTADSEVTGVVQHAGRETPVLSLRRLLGLPSAKSLAREHLIVIRYQDQPYGLLVDNVLGAREIESQQVAPLPKVAWNPTKAYFEGVVSLGETRSRGPSSLLAHDTAFEPTRSVLLLSPAGLIGDASTSPATRWKGYPLDLAALRRHAVTTSGQIMLFDISHPFDQDVRTTLALSIQQVLEVVQLRPLVRVPGGPNNLEGLLPWRRQLVPVIDLSRPLGLTAQPSPSVSRMIVARSSSHELIGFYATSDIRTVRLPIEAKPCPLTTSARTDFYHGSYLTETGMLILPNIDRFLASDRETVSA